MCSFNLYHIHLILTISSFNLYHIYLISTKFPARFWFNTSASTVINLWLIEYLIKRNHHWINSGKETKLNTQALTNLSLKYNSVVLNCILNPEICWNSQFLFLIYFNPFGISKFNSPQTLVRDNDCDIIIILLKSIWGLYM